MGYLQDLGQDSNLRWKALSDQHEDGHPSSALRRPHASKQANPEIPVRRRLVCPLLDLPSTARSDSIPVHERAVSDVSILPEDTDPFCHMRSSMGRLSLRDSGKMSRKMPLRVIRESTAEKHVEGGDAPESESDGTSGRASVPETRPPISIRSHIAAQLKGPDQDRNGMRIRRSDEFGRPETSSAKDQHTIARANFDHCLPTTAKEMEDNGSLPKHGNMTSYNRQRKQRPVFGRPPKFPVHDSHGTYPSGQDAQMSLAIPRNHHRQEALDSFNGHCFSPLPAENYHANIGDKGILPVATEAKPKDLYPSMKGGSFPKFKPAPPNRVDDVMTSSFDKGVLTTSGNGHMPLRHTGNERIPTYKDPYRSEQGLMGWVDRSNPDLNRALSPGGIRMPAVPLNVSSPPPYTGRPPTPPMEGHSSFADVNEPVHPRASNRSRNDSPRQHGTQGHFRLVGRKPKPQCWEHGCNGRQFSTFRNLLRHQREKSGQAAKASCPGCGAEFTRTTARNGHVVPHHNCKLMKQPLTSCNAIDGTKGISSTISKDSSADECLRQAKLLADMGERSQRTHNENDTKSTSAGLRVYMEEMEERDELSEIYIDPYVKDVDVGGNSIDDTRTYISVVPPGIKEAANVSRTRNRTLNRMPSWDSVLDFSMISHNP